MIEIPQQSEPSEQGADVAKRPRLRRLSDTLYAWVQEDGSWWLNNAGVIVSEGEAALFDTCATARRTDALIAAMKRVTGAHVGVVVNSHEHSDHSHGNSRFPNATIIAHPAARSAMLRRGISRHPEPFTPIEVGDLVLSAPTVTFDRRLVVWVGSIALQLIAADRPAHTTGDVVGWVEGEGVLFSGDLVWNGVTPLLMGGSVLGTIAVLEEQLRPLDIATIVPGHGEPGGVEILEHTLAYAELVLRIARSGLARRLSPLEAAAGAELGEFARWLDGERLVGNLHRAYADLSGAPAGERLDYGAIMREMTALTGKARLVTRA